MSNRVLSAGFAVIAVLMIIAMVKDVVIPVAGAVILVLGALAVFCYSKKMTSVLFFLLIALPTGVMAHLAVYAGPVPIRFDDIMAYWVFALWIAAVIDGDGFHVPACSGRIILLLVALCGAGMVRGLVSGYDVQGVMAVGRHSLGYLFFFPCMWLLNRKDGLKPLTVSFMAATVVAAIAILYMGFAGGDNVYTRATSGLRVTSREVNVIMCGLFLGGFTLWKKKGVFPVIPAVFLLLTMGASLLLGQSRAIWIAVFAGALAALVADLAGQGRSGVKVSTMISRTLLLVIFIAGSVGFIAATGLLSVNDVIARGGGADGGTGMDVSLLARFLSWYEILITVTVSPLTLLFGKGFGHEILYFRPDLFQMVSIPYVDGSFFQLLLNTGVIGMVLLALLYARGIADSFRLTVMAGNEWESIGGMWLTASFISLTIAALFSSVITNYRFTYIWAYLFAVMETMKLKQAEKRLKQPEK